MNFCRLKQIHIEKMYESFNETDIGDAIADAPAILRVRLCTAIRHHARKDYGEILDDILTCYATKCVKDDVVLAALSEIEIEDEAEHRARRFA